MPRPQFFLLGAPKCGTTAMYQWLAAHPGLFLPAKELHHWGSDLHHRSPRLSAEAYEALFEPAGARLPGEAAVWYLMSEAAPGELRAYSPEARLVAMIRHPVELIESLHSQLLYSGEEDLKDLGQALEAEPDRRAGRRIPASTHRGLEAPPDEALHYRRVVDFAPQIRRWREAFGAEGLLVVLHEEMKADPLATFARIVDFIGGPPGFQPEAKVVNPNKTARSQGAQRLIQGLRWGPWNRLVPGGRLRTAARRGFERLQSMNTRTERRPPMDHALRARLLAELRPGVEALEEELGRGLPAWKT